MFSRAENISAGFLARIYFCLAFFFFYPSGILFSQTYIVKPGSNVNLRAGKGTSFGALAVLKPGSEVRAVETEGEWWKVEYNGQRGYINSTFLMPKEKPKQENKPSYPVNNSEKQKDKTEQKENLNKGKAEDSTSKFYLDRIDEIIIGPRLDYRNLDIIFKNNTANFIGNVTYNHPVTDWRFVPSFNTINGGIFAVSKFGTFALTAALNTEGKYSSKMYDYSISIPYKKLEFNLNYLRYKGLERTEPVYESKVFYKDMSFTPISADIQYRFGKLKNQFLYVPKTVQNAAAIGLGYSYLNVKNSSDFIPAIITKTNPGLPDSIVELSGSYLYKFTSKGVTLVLKYDVVFPFYKLKLPKSKDRSGSLNINGRMGITVIDNFQRFNYYSYTTFNNSQFTKYQNGKGTTVSYILNGLIVCDVGKVIAGVGVTYYNYSYGHANDGSGTPRLGFLKMSISGTGNGSVEGNNHVENERISYNFFLGFRFGFKKYYDKIDNKIEELKSKAKKK